jgi:hypothetical protein
VSFVFRTPSKGPNALHLCVEAQDLAVVLCLALVVPLPVREADLGLAGHDDPRLGAVHARLPRALRGVVVAAAGRRDGEDRREHEERSAHGGRRHCPRDTDESRSLPDSRGQEKPREPDGVPGEHIREIVDAEVEATETDGCNDQSGTAGDDDATAR